MANIYELLEQINSAIYGEDVRGSIHDAIEQCYEDATGNPNSLSAVLEKLFNGAISGIGDVIDGAIIPSEYVEGDQYELTKLNSISLPPGTWLLLTSAFSRHSVSLTDDVVYTNDIALFDTDEMEGTSSTTEPEEMGFSPDVMRFHPDKKHYYFSDCNARVITIDEDDSRLSEEGTVDFYLFCWTNYELGGWFKSSLTAIKVKSNNSSGEEISLVEQVAHNTADIAALESKSFSLDANDYLTVG